MPLEHEHRSSSRFDEDEEQRRVDKVNQPAPTKKPKLTSNEFKGDPKLEKCLVDDSGRINSKLNNTGPHIEKIQSVLEALEEVDLKSEKGSFGPKTSLAVKKFKNDRNLLKASQKPGQADETIGKGTIGRLDTEMADFEKNGRRRGRRVIPVPEIFPRKGADLARRDVSFALTKVDNAIQKLTEFETTLKARRVTESELPAFDPVTVAALSTHFRLGLFDAPAIAPRRPVTLEDVAHILNHFRKMRNVFTLNATAFKDGDPKSKNGNPVPAVSFLNSGEVIFGSHFRNFTDTQALMIGTNSRVAILIHEGFHSVDVAQKSGDDDNVHISEFNAKYDQQSADNSLFNPSSYASFAAHVFPPGVDPNPRFGLDAKGRFL